MDLILAVLCISFVVFLYFRNNPMNHSSKFMFRRFVNWFPLGMSYAFLYMARYNLNVSKNALGSMMTKEDFGWIFGAGTITYGLSFLLNGPLVDKIGGKKGIVIAALGACMANGAMGIVTYLFLHNRLHANLTVVFTVLYCCNMFFQSYGAVSIIKVKAYWFHVRERGVFGAIFGTLISLGVYLAFDWGQAIVDAAKAHPTTPRTGFQEFINMVFAVDMQPVDSIWLVFFIPSAFLIFWALIDVWLIKDTPDEAGYDDFDTHDAHSGLMDKEYSMKDLLVGFFTNPIMITISLVEFTAGVIRNGILQWYFIFANEVKQPGAEFFKEHWGILLCFAGIIGGFGGGMVSDKLFHSRRGPPVAICSAAMVILTSVMALFIYSSPFVVGACAILISLFVIGVHSLMSGTAAADFGGRKATATAAGVTDGFVYLGSGLQSICLGYLTTQSWAFWPVFLIPFAILGVVFSLRMWKALPEATKNYLRTVEKVDITTIEVRVKTTGIAIEPR